MNADTDKITKTRKYENTKVREKKQAKRSEGKKILAACTGPFIFLPQIFLRCKDGRLTPSRQAAKGLMQECLCSWRSTDEETRNHEIRERHENQAESFRVLFSVFRVFRGYLPRRSRVTVWAASKMGELGGIPGEERREAIVSDFEQFLCVSAAPRE